MVTSILADKKKGLETDTDIVSFRDNLIQKVYSWLANKPH